jgi:hypothetical protein
MALSINDTRHINTLPLCRVSCLFIVMLNDIILIVIMLNVLMPSVIMLNVVMLNVIMLNVIMLNVIMLSVVGPMQYGVNYDRKIF